ncbi:MAG TPA: hypothetical protein PKX28_04815 [Candidatus Hydrogenedentes bacterium]|nr:hypothetical protein [Candidatus Hydrogenedentota bacterium]
MNAMSECQVLPEWEHPPVSKLLPAERHRIEFLREEMCERLNREVSFDEAAREWFSHHALPWRERRLRGMLYLQRQAMDTHKWIRSEQERRDLGSAAILEWIQHYAAAWREWFEREYEWTDPPLPE